MGKVASFPTSDSRSGSSTRKIVSLETMVQAANEARSVGRTIVQAHGAFDLLHLGHVRHFRAARKLGDMVVVTVTADTEVK